MKTLSVIIPGFVYLLSTTLAITFISVLLVDIINDNKTNPPVSFKQPEELFPKFVKLITFEKINLDFAGVEFPNPK